MMRYTAALAFLSTVAALNNGVGQTPAMGWNSWNVSHCFDIIDSTDISTLDVMSTRPSFATQQIN